jgi:hypothetical protein
MNSVASQIIGKIGLPGRAHAFEGRCRVHGGGNGEKPSQPQQVEQQDNIAVERKKRWPARRWAETSGPSQRWPVRPWAPALKITVVLVL